MTQPLIYLIKRACSRVQGSRNCDIYKTNAEKKKKQLEASLKALSHEAIFSATCNATDDESIARQVAELMLHVAYWSGYLRKVDAHSIFPAIPNTIAKRGVTRAISCTACLANAVALPSCRKTLLRVTTVLVHSPPAFPLKFHAFRFFR